MQDVTGDLRPFSWKSNHLTFTTWLLYCVKASMCTVLKHLCTRTSQYKVVMIFSGVLCYEQNGNALEFRVIRTQSDVKKITVND